MINVLVIKEKQTIKTIEATGHSGYAKHGQDIVCSAVSKLMETLANGLTEVVKAKTNVIVDDKIAHMSITLDEIDNEKFKMAQVLMNTILIGIKSVAEDGFSKFIKIKEKQK